MTSDVAKAVSSFLARKRQTGRVVTATPDFKRILELPRRPPVANAEVAPGINHAQLWTDVLQIKDSPTARSLNDEQGWALSEAYLQKGLLADYAVGTGKCVAGDTEVFDGLQRRTVQELAASGQSFRVMTKSHDHQMVFAEAQAFFSGRKPCVGLTLADGAEAILSTDHAVFTPRGWVPAGQLVPGELVGTPRDAPADGQRALEISDDEVVMAAYLLSDGGVSQPGTDFTNVTPAVVEDITGVASRLGRSAGGSWTEKRLAGQYIRQHAPSKGKPAITYGIRGIGWFRDKWSIHGLAKEKRIPAQFWGMNESQIALFLNRFWACDGYVEQRGFGITLASERMVADIKFLLLRLGIRASKHYRVAMCNGKKFHAWRLALSGAAASRFLNTVGDVLGKEDRCDQLRQVLRASSRNTNFDIVPISYDDCAGIADELGLVQWKRGPKRTRSSVSRFMGATKGQCVGRETFERFCSTYGYRGQHAWLASTNLVWERVASVEPVGELPVFDVSVPKTGCFVGDGMVLHNTDIGFLIPSVVECERPLIIMPANALETKTLKKDYPEALQRWKLHPNLKFISYETLAREKQADFFERGMFDLLVCDEVHRIKNHRAAATRRILRYKEQYDWVRCFGMSGTLTSKSLRDYSHLAALCLGEGSPLPLRYMAIEDWADALDEGIEEEFRPAPGVLHQFCAAGETAREGFQRRLRETPGYVSALTNNVRCSLVISEDRTLVVPDVVKDAVKKLRLSNHTPAGDFISSALELSQHLEELSAGFAYTWVWPGGKKDLPWVNARRAWKKYASWVIKHSGSIAVGGRTYDTPHQVALAADRGQLPEPDPDVAPANVREVWLKERARLAGVLQEAFAGKHWEPEEYITWDSKREPPRRAVWISDYMVEHALRWLEANDRGIVWSNLKAFQTRMRMVGAIVYGGGENEIVNEKRSCVASLSAHGEAKNLQHAYSKNMFLSIMASGKGFEQALGRTHRQGQPEDEVTAQLALPSYEAWAAFHQARRDAAYIHETTGRAQKLKYADIDVSSEEEVAVRAAKWPREPMWCQDWSRTQHSHENEMKELSEKYGFVYDSDDSEDVPSTSDGL